MSTISASPANPLLKPWNTPFGAPPFAEIKPEDFRGAFDVALAEHKAEVVRIAGDRAEPTFDNTIGALERAGRSLEKVSSVFFNLVGTDGNETLEAVERDMAPILARHRNEIYLNQTLFQRVDGLYARRGDLVLAAEQRRVLERYHTIFSRAGAGLQPAAKQRLAEITERLATLGTTFGQNVLADEKAYQLVLDGEADLDGLPDFLRAAAAQAAEERGLRGKHVITLGRSSIEPFLQFSRRRDLRDQAFQAWAKRGEGGGTTDNRAIIAEMVALRAERARLLGHRSFAHFRLDDTMAKTPEAAMLLLDSVWSAGRKRALEERDDLQALAQAEGGNFEIGPADWRYYSERLRKERFDLDESEIKPYLQLDNMIEAAFDVAGRLFGLAFKERTDLPVYHREVRVWEVTGENGRPIGLFLGDYFARPSKRSGAWMSSFRDQEKLIGDVRPIIVNVLNFSRAGDGEPALLSLDDARTLFHEFGHALHGLLSDVTYPLIAGTAVPRDFVEFPSQLYEHWFDRPEVLSRFAVHYRTGEPMPDDLLKRVLATRTFNQGFQTVEYVASALVDLNLHLLSEAEGANVDVIQFERETLDRIGMPSAIAMRHRAPHFGHVFSGEGYSAGYYSYLWSEVLDADGFGAFLDAGDVFDPATAKRLRDFVYAAGSLRDPTEAYQSFRGRSPEPEALLRKRGLS